MPKRRQSEPSDDQFADGNACVSVHDYRIPNKPPLDPAAEHRLIADIQAGKSAFDEIAEEISSALLTHLNSHDLAPFAPGSEDAQQLIRDLVADQLVKHAKNERAPLVIAEAIAEVIRVAIGNHLQNLGQLPEIPFEEWAEQTLPKTELVLAVPSSLAHRHGLWQAIAGRECAIDGLIETHLRLAVPFARRAMRQPFEFPDLMSEAVIILRQAADAFDPRSGNRFSSYVKGALQRELWRRSPSDLGLTRHSDDQLRTYDRTRQALQHEQRGSVTLDDVYRKLACPETTRLQIENVRRILAAERRPRSKGDGPSPDLLDRQLPSPLQEASTKEDTTRLLAAFSALSGFEKRIVVGHCIRGLSFRQMAKRFHKSPPTLSHICEDALSKLARRIDPNRPSHRPR